MATASGITPPKPNGRIAFTYPSFTLYQIARFFVVLATEMQSVAVGWQVYEITRRPLDLGLVGLAQFLPGIIFLPLSGHTADRYHRSKVLTVGYVALAFCSALLLSIALRGTRTVYPIYVAVGLIGVARAFTGPASRAILPQLIPEEHFESAFAWGATFFEIATILGPAVGGVVYTIFRGPAAVYAVAMACGLSGAIAMSRVKLAPRKKPLEILNWKTVFAGLHYIWREKIVLGSISLDLFAVLLGGAVALLPVYARDILHTGPWGLGLLRCAPAVGAGIMALFLAHRPLGKRAGMKMLFCVAGFGVCTILFGVSHSLALSLTALVFVGATDMVSVVVRGILIQLRTPDEMRGRVNAVDMVFIGASNELGAFESGATAAIFGTVPAVVLGGVGTLIVTALWAWMFPDLRNADQLITPTRKT
ncbi:MAG TPA: MFS transporter [Candidatus Acidoferrales bacterium]|jgi:MFS family permease|nr:MFS transporter [Candidatus Acidoferrales bacterium]